MSTEKTPTARVHRFRKQVAVELEDGPTIYLTPETARRLAWTLTSFANDIENHEFEDSLLPPWSVFQED